jgi:hypothetical protein
MGWMHTPLRRKLLRVWAFHSMHTCASPGSDEFGPDFYKVTWPITSQRHFDFFEAFHLFFFLDKLTLSVVQEMSGMEPYHPIPVVA